jgi:hypothetical protein
MRRRLDALPEALERGFISSELPVVQAALRSVLEQGMPRGRVFCEWGSGMGAVCALAASLSFEAHGIEIQDGLVAAARELTTDLGLEATFAQGSFLLPGDEDLVVNCEHTRCEVTADVYGELGITPEACDVVFTYPWHGEEEMYDRLFLRRATPGALLLTYHDCSRVLVQRRTDDAEELQSLGWMETPGD